MSEVLEARKITKGMFSPEKDGVQDEESDDKPRVSKAYNVYKLDDWLSSYGYRHVLREFLNEEEPNIWGDGDEDYVEVGHFLAYVESRDDIGFYFEFY